MRALPFLQSAPRPVRRRQHFAKTGARAYLRDVPDAELHLLDTGHFALEEKLPEIAPLIATFLERIWRAPAAKQPRC